MSDGFKGNWDNHLPLIEFSYNNCYNLSIGMALFEYGRKCPSFMCWDKVGEGKILGPK